MPLFKTILLQVSFLVPFLTFSQTLQRYEFEEYYMGTQFRLLFYAASDSVAQQAAQASFQRVSALNSILSDYLEDSELNRLSASAGSGKKVAVSDELWAVLVYAQRIARKSKGAFDISIGPLSKLWRRAFRQQAFPDLAALEDAKSKVNYRWIKLYPKQQAIKLKKEGMRLDLGGIAKGYAIDEAMNVLHTYGIEHALADGGGDLLLAEAPPNSDGWQVKILNGGTKSLKNCAIATSGDHYKFLEWQGKKYAHIIDPKTGLGVSEQKQISVVAQNCMQADALASACVILSKTKASKLSQQLGAELFILRVQ